MALPPLPPCPEPVHAQLARLTAGLAAILAGRLVGVYLHGSLALGCFQPATSDLDVLVVTEQPPSPEQLSRLAALLLDVSAAPRPIELSSLTRSYLQPWQYPTPYDFHYSEDWRARMTARIPAGAWADAPIPAGTDPDLAAHCTIVRARGIVLAGAPIAAVFPPVPHADYLASIVDDYWWAKDRLAPDTAVYFVLNACRVLASLDEGAVLSKAEGGAWGATHFPAARAALIAAARAAYAAGRPLTAAEASPEARAAFAAAVESRLPARACAAEPPG